MYEAIRDGVVSLGCAFEIVFVDDGSQDSTVERLRTLARNDPRIVIVRFRRNFGQTAAMTAGIEHARGRYIVTMDGDLQNDPADIPMMVRKMREGYDLVVGWRIKRQDKFVSRKLPSKLANWLIGRVTGLPIRDNGCSLKVYRADVIQRVPLYSDMHRFIPAMTIPLGARIAQVGVRHHARQFGASKYGLSRVYKVLIDLMVVKSILLFSRQPLARFSGIAAIMGVAAILALAATLAGPATAGHGGGMVIGMAVTGLLGSLAVFLILLGLATAAMMTGRRSERDGPAPIPGGAI